MSWYDFFFSTQKPTENYSFFQRCFDKREQENWVTSALSKSICNSKCGSDPKCSKCHQISTLIIRVTNPQEQPLKPGWHLCITQALQPFICKKFTLQSTTRRPVLSPHSKFLTDGRSFTREVVLQITALGMKVFIILIHNPAGQSITINQSIKRSVLDAFNQTICHPSPAVSQRRAQQEWADETKCLAVLME